MFTFATRRVLASVSRQWGAASLSTSSSRMAEMKFTFAAPNAVWYNEANVKQVSAKYSMEFGLGFH